MKALNDIPEAWRLALQREKEAGEFYGRMAQAATDEGSRSLFEMLVEQEKNHYAILEAEYRRIFEPDMEMAKDRVPIAWYDWEDSTFELADTLDLPVLLYVTAPWCEPCHLMEETTLADSEVIKAINDHVIPILVDADKRPDVDSRYSKGGWPTTAFLDARGEVLEGYNFLTSDQMLLALQRIAARYESGEAAALTGPTIAIRPEAPLTDFEERPQAVGELTPDLVDDAVAQVMAAFDRVNGGFGSAPKFHHASVVEFALAMAHRTGDKALTEAVHQSLESMAKGEIYDPVEGGFFRYATAADWSRPHYEKMAGDQAQLLGLYLRAYQASGRKRYLETARGVLSYLDAVMWDRDRGFFYSSQEADPEYYALTAEGRKGREKPYVEKAAYTERNAAVASAYMLASAVLNEPRYADLAIRALEFIWQKSYTEGLGMFHYFDLQPHLPGLLADQVSMAQAWLDAYEHYGREVYLQRAETLMRFADNALRDGDGRYYDTPAAPEAVGRLRIRKKPFCENVLAAEATLRLYRFTGREEYHQAAQETLEALVPYRADVGLEVARFGLTVDRILRKPLMITVVGENEDPIRAELLRAARRAYAANKTVQAIDPVWEQARLADLGYPPEPAPVAYVCLGTLCTRPTADSNELLAQAQAMVGQDRLGQGSDWEYKGHTLEEGFKVEPGERFQAYARVIKGGDPVFRYCVWTSREAAARRWPDLDLDTDQGRARLEQEMRSEGRKRIQAKIDAGSGENWLLDLRADGEEELVLEAKRG